MKHSLFSYEPDTYKKSQVMREILNAQEAQLLKEEERQSGIVADMYPSQTIHPERWEKEYGIEQAEGVEQRRSNILAKIKGTGTVTSEVVKDITLSYIDGIVDVEEDPDDSMIYITVESEDQIQEVKSLFYQLYGIIPAHIEVHVSQTVAPKINGILHHGEIMEVIEKVDIL